MYKDGKFYIRLGLPDGASFPTSPSHGDIFLQSRIAYTYLSGISNWRGVADYLSGDISIADGVVTTIKLQNRTVADVDPDTGEVLTWDGVQWTPISLSGIAFSGIFDDYLLVTGSRAGSISQAQDFGANGIALEAIEFDGASAANILTVPDGAVDAFNTKDGGGLEYLRVDSDNDYLLLFPGGGGNVGIGTVLPLATIHAAANSGWQGIFERATTGANAPVTVKGFKARGTLGSKSVVVDGDALFTIDAQGYDGDSYETAAIQRYYVDGAVIDGRVPGRIEFWTTRASDGDLSVRATIKNDGDFGIGRIPSYILDVQKNQNALTRMRITNTTNDTAARVQISLVTGGASGAIGVFSANYTTSGHAIADSMRIVAGSDASAGMNFVTVAAADIGFWPNQTLAMTIQSGGNVKIASLAGAGVRNVVAAADGTLSAP